MSEKSKHMKGIVRCSNCGEAYHEVTLAYRPDQTPNGTMFVLRRPWGPSGENWDAFPQDPSIRSADLCCPGCGGVYEKIHDRIEWSYGGKPMGRGEAGYERIVKEHGEAVTKERRMAGLVKARRRKVLAQRAAEYETKKEKA